MRWLSVKHNQNLTAKSDVLAGLSNIELQKGRSLAAIAAGDLKNSVFQAEPGESPGHGRFIVEGNVGPFFLGIFWREFERRCGRAIGCYVDIAAVRTAD